MTPQHARSLLAALVGLAVAGLASAQTSPYYIGASLGVNHDSNVFRLPSGAAQADTVISAGLLGGIDQPIGRQRVYASAIVRNNRYNELSRLDNTSYGVNAGLDWSTIEKLSGSVSLTANSNLINYGGANSNLTTVRNVERSNQAVASVQYGGASLLVLQGSVTHRAVAYSDPAYQGNDLKQDAMSAGVSYRPSSALTVGAALRHTRGDYTRGASSFSRNDLDLTGTWMPTGLSTLNTRLSFGRQTAEGNNFGRDFSGATGYLSWVYQPTGRLQFNTWVSRDTGAESSFFNTGTGQIVRGIGDNSQFTNTLALDASYLATGKIRVTAGVRTARRSLVNGTLEGSDTVNTASLGASYQALRNVSVSCSVGRETRGASGVLSSPYGATYGGCSAQVTLQ